MSYAVMMLCRAGPVYMPTESSYAYTMHVITVSRYDDEIAALVEIARLRPRGYNRECAQFWVAPWDDRFGPHGWPRAALQWWGK